MKDLIEKWKLNNALLAKKMGMSRGSFNNKLKERRDYKFSKDELFKLESIINELKTDIHNNQIGLSNSPILEYPKGVFNKMVLNDNLEYSVAVTPQTSSHDKEN